MSQETDQKEAARTTTESHAATAAHEVGLKSQMTSVMNRKQNPDFYEKFTKTDLKDSEKWGHLVNEFQPWLADDHILANRRQVYRRQREILNRTRAVEAIVGASPGVRLKEKPLLNALAQGVNVELDEPVPLDAAGQSTVEITDPGFTDPMTAEERSAMADLADVATARQSQGVDNAGSDALTTVKTEQTTVRNDETEASGIRSSLAGVMD